MNLQKKKGKRGGGDSTNFNKKGVQFSRKKKQKEKGSPL